MKLYEHNTRIKQNQHSPILNKPEQNNGLSMPKKQKKLKGHAHSSDRCANVPGS